MEIHIPNIVQEWREQDSTHADQSDEQTRQDAGRDQLELVRVIRPVLQMLSEYSVVAEQGRNATRVQEQYLLPALPPSFSYVR